MYPKWLWSGFSLPGVVWLVLLFLVPMYAVVGVAFGSVDPILQTRAAGRAVLLLLKLWTSSTARLAPDEGLRRLFTTTAEWADVSVTPAAGTASALAMLLGTYVEIAFRRSALARPPVYTLNRLGAALDARVTMLREPVPGSLIPNLHVVAVP